MPVELSNALRHASHEPGRDGRPAGDYASLALSAAATLACLASVTTALAWWVPILGLGVVTAALAYVLGIAATRRLGSRLAAFVGLGEAVASVVLAWLLLDEAPRAIQLLGGVLILLGVVFVKLGEPRQAPLPV